MADEFQDQPQRRTAADPDLALSTLFDNLREALKLMEDKPYQPDSPPTLTELIRDIRSCAYTPKPGEVFLEIGTEAWESLKARTPKPTQIAGDSVQIHDLTGIRALLNPDYGSRWELRHVVSGDVLYEGNEP